MTVKRKRQLRRKRKSGFGGSGGAEVTSGFDRFRALSGDDESQDSQDSESETEKQERKRARHESAEEVLKLKRELEAERTGFRNHTIILLIKRPGKIMKFLF